MVAARTMTRRQIARGESASFRAAEYGIWLAASGSGAVMLPPGSARFGEGALLLAQPRTVVTFACGSSETLTVLGVAFGEEDLLAVGSLGDSAAYALPLRLRREQEGARNLLYDSDEVGDSAQGIGALMAAMARESEIGLLGHKAIQRGYLAVMLNLLARVQERAGLGQPHAARAGASERVLRVLVRLRGPGGHSLGAVELAAMCGWSVDHFGRVFREVTGQTLPRYHRQQKVNRGMMLLLASDEPVEVVAEACGYYDASTFRHAFKACLGITPEMYRRQHSLPEGGPAPWPDGR